MPLNEPVMGEVCSDYFQVQRFWGVQIFEKKHFSYKKQPNFYKWPYFAIFGSIILVFKMIQYNNQNKHKNKINSFKCSQ